MYLRQVRAFDSKARTLVETFHSYKPKFIQVGRVLTWLVEVDGKTVGAVSIASTLALFPLEFVRQCGIDMKMYDGRKVLKSMDLNVIANVWRFVLTPDAPANTGSKALSLLAKLAPKAWKERYNDELVLLITFVGGGNTGTIYRAANWKFVCQTHPSKEMRKFSLPKEQRWKFGTWTKPGSKAPGKLMFMLPLQRDWQQKIRVAPDKSSWYTEKNG